MIKARTAKFQIGQIVRHRIFSFRGVIFDIDPEFNNTEEWWLSIPEEVRPHKDQPFYHLLAENSESEYVAYVSEQNLLLTIPASRSGIRRSPRFSSRTSRAAIARAIPR
jgi:heat shock protein HspQ